MNVVVKIAIGFTVILIGVLIGLVVYYAKKSSDTSVKCPIDAMMSPTCPASPTCPVCPTCPVSTECPVCPDTSKSAEEIEQEQIMKERSKQILLAIFEKFKQKYGTPAMIDKSKLSDGYSLKPFKDSYLYSALVAQRELNINGTAPTEGEYLKYFKDIANLIWDKKDGSNGVDNGIKQTKRLMQDGWFAFDLFMCISNLDKLKNLNDRSNDIYDVMCHAYFYGIINPDVFVDPMDTLIKKVLSN